MAKRIVDLIYVQPVQDEETLFSHIFAEIDHWGNTLKALQEEYFERHLDPGSQDIMEIMSMRKFLKKFLYRRTMWIKKEVEDSSLRREYLKVLPPFHQKGGIKSLLQHFFQVEESQDKKGLVYKKQNSEDRELRILWDIYKLRKTIESIGTIERSLKKSPRSPRSFPKANAPSVSPLCAACFICCFRCASKRNIKRSCTPNSQAGI